MNKSNKYIIIYGLIYSYVFLIYLQKEQHMNLISNILLVSVPPIITGIAVYLNQKKSQINRNTETITDFNANLTTNISELEKNIGRENNDKSLTGQHSDISNLLEKEIATVEKRYNEEEARLRTFSHQQKNIAEISQELMVLIEDWNRLTMLTEKLQLRIYELENENNPNKTKQLQTIK